MRVPFIPKEETIDYGMDVLLEVRIISQGQVQIRACRSTLDKQ